MSAAKKNVVTRPKRVPLSGPRDLLTIEGAEAGFVYRWINDLDNRIGRALQAGYEFVEDVTKVGEKTVDFDPRQNNETCTSKGVGKGVTAYLMRIPKEWYDQDQAEKQAAINAGEEDMYRQLNQSGDGRYGKVIVESDF